MATITIKLDTARGTYSQRERFRGAADLQELLAFQAFIAPSLAALETSLRTWRMMSRRQAQADADEGVTRA